VLIFPFALIVGSLAGWATGGSWRALSEVRFRHTYLLLEAIATQVALELPGISSFPLSTRFAIVVVTYFVAGWWVFENGRGSSGGARLGLGLVAGGWALNLLAMLPNRGMPVSQWALDRAGFAPSTSVIHGHLSKHVLANHATVLRSLGDVIPVSWFRTVISPGDIVMTVGIGVFVLVAMRKQPSGDSPVAMPGPISATQADGSG
jgi:hypothetical protein